ncbi:MAG: cysteine desulfurase [Planctomycetaceae bacterium]|nr:cysteine desulfurase [Planctomycetaceae bacterium]
MPKSIYLDNNATTCPLPEVLAAMDRVWRNAFANPGSRHAAGRAARRVLEESRDSIARILDAEPDEVVFTSGGTESINLAIHGLARSKGTIITGPAEHPATAETIATLMQRGWAPEELAVDASGRLSGPDTSLIPQKPLTNPIPLSLGRGDRGEGTPCRVASDFTEPARRRGRAQAAKDANSLPSPPAPLPKERGVASRPLNATGFSGDESDVKLVSLLLAHNETGVVQDIAPLIAHCNAKGIPTHLDAVQAVGKIPVSFKRLGATALSFGAHKFHGPRGIGGLLVRRGVRLAPLHHGGHQEAERRPGTEPVALIAGLAAALESWHRQAEDRMRRMSSARDRLEAGLIQRCSPVVIHGREAVRLPNTSSVAFPGLDGEALLVALDLEGVACSLGSTCASGSAEPAPILLAMGVPPETALATVRFSVSFETTIEEIDEAVRRIAGVVERLR